MDQRIFEQLDRLQHGARNPAPPPPLMLPHEQSQTPASDRLDGDYSIQTYDPRSDAEVDPQSLILDSFDQQLLRQQINPFQHNPDVSSYGKVFLPRSASRYHNERWDSEAMPRSQSRYQSRQFLERPASTFDSYQCSEPLSSSSGNVPLPSSPSFQASRCHTRTVRQSQYSDQYHRRNDTEPELIEDCLVPGVTEAQGEQSAAFQAGSGTYHRSQAKASQQTARLHEPTTGLSLIQGIQLISVRSLPDRFRALFPYPLFNAVQSKCFDTIYNANDNFVLSAPTGSGKTVILELAICRLLNSFTSGSYKIIYQAPTKSLCSERKRDWQAKFGPFDLQCVELTGDTENGQLRTVQHASIIVTTPEKWDSITRKWRDHQKLMQMVKLFLIDEVHTLKEDRGATLEANVSRMKSVGADVRFIALSATVPNADDVAKWLGRDSQNVQVPAARERFGEEFRPVRLQKHVCGYQASSNDFAFEKHLNGKLPEVIAKWSQRKPIMIFCFTRNSCVETAKLLATWWTTQGPRDRYWSAPRQQVVAADKDLGIAVRSGVAFHHAGLTLQDRSAVERSYLAGEIGVICCTSTLAVGVNLPCHMTIIKNTVTYQQNTGVKEYSDLEIMQMLGRAGRPQFDDSAIAIIMTRNHRVQHYEKMITGQEKLESRLHVNLIDHLNAEISLGTITSASTARNWLRGTFLYVRLHENPEHYKIESDAPGRTFEERLEYICDRGLRLLRENDLVTSSPRLSCTEFGDAMARYYLQFDTMKIIRSLPPQAKISELLSMVAQAAEFKDIRWRAGEKTLYKDLNKSGSIKFPIPGNLDAPAHKVSLIIQSVLSAVDLPSEEYKHRVEFNAAKSVIFQNVNRLIRCVIDCQLFLNDAVTVRNALMLTRSLSAMIWDDSPLHMKQLEGVGVVAVRKLVGIGIKSIEDLQDTESYRIEQALSRNPPFGAQLQERARQFPSLRVSLSMVGEPMIKRGGQVNVKAKAEIGFMNEVVPHTFQRKPVYVCLLVETSDGQLVHFARISAKNLSTGQDVLFTAKLTTEGQTIRAHVMCEEVAASSRQAQLKPDLPPSMVLQPRPIGGSHRQEFATGNSPKTSRRRTSARDTRVDVDIGADEYGDLTVEDADLVDAENRGFIDVEDLCDDTRKWHLPCATQDKAASDRWEALREPRRLDNGKWECNHACKDKTACKHLCCREGLDKKPKPPKMKVCEAAAQLPSKSKQTQLGLTTSKKLAQEKQAAVLCKHFGAKYSQNVEKPKEARDLASLHDSIPTRTPKITVMSAARQSTSMTGKKQLPLKFTQAARRAEEEADSTQVACDESGSEDLTNMEEFIRGRPRGTSRMSAEEAFEDDVGPEEMALKPASLHDLEQDPDLRLPECPEIADVMAENPSLSSLSRSYDDCDIHRAAGLACDMSQPIQMPANACVGNVASLDQNESFHPSKKRKLNIRETAEPVIAGQDCDGADGLKKWFEENFGLVHFDFVS